MNELDQKINTHFPGLVVRKDLVKMVKGNAIVPSYVLEYLLGQYCATSDESTIQEGIEMVKDILRKHYVHRNEANSIRSSISIKGRLKVIDRITVDFNESNDQHEASFSNLGIKKVLVSRDTVEKHRKLLVGGVWCICDVEYIKAEEQDVCPWVMNSIKPIQLSHLDSDGLVAARREFSTDEWIDLLIQSIGFNPALFGRRSKLLQLARLIPYCERNYNLIELGPKGTGKSHIYSEFSPHGILISGGEVTVPKLFVNNTSGKIGLVGYWDTVAFDEFAGKTKRVDKALVDIMKNYMANKSFSRGVETLGAEASMVFVGNTKHTVPYMLKNSDLFDELPDKYHDSAFLDRLHFYIPGWEVDIIRGEMFSDGYGFVVDYLAEVLRSFRNYDFSDQYQEHFTLCSDISTRDRDGIHKTFSGLMKIIFPHGEASIDEIEEILQFAIEGRKRIKDQLLRMDATYPKVHFAYSRKGESEEKTVFVLEEKEYPQHYMQKGNSESVPDAIENAETVKKDHKSSADSKSAPKAAHISFMENQRGVNFESLLGMHLKGAKKITITDPYLRLFYQIRNLMELMELIVKLKSEDDEVKVHVVTSHDEFKTSSQDDCLLQIQESCEAAGVTFSWEYDETGTIHARHIVTDTGWKILMDRGLDIFQHYEMNNSFSFANRLQQFRACKAFEVTYIRIEDAKKN